MVLLKPVKQKKISDQVFDQIRELIFRGNLKPGDKLMPERDVAQTMDVSRTSVRSAITRLVTMGLVEHQQGKGTFVVNPSHRNENPFATAMIEQDATIYDLLEVRMGLECMAASLAAKRADAADISAMEQSIEEMEKAIMQDRLGTQADTSFHMAVAYATKNPLHIQVMRNFYDYLFHGIRESLQSLYEDPKNIEVILSQHRGIMSAIINRDQDKAFKNMQKHIDYVKYFFKNKEK
jgi:GntR family transcriptional regulator, transcriptional repressor for pyruvate dehydrogenase complex